MNRDVHNYSSPRVECHVETEEVDNDTLVIIGFRNSTSRRSSLLRPEIAAHRAAKRVLTFYPGTSSSGPRPSRAAGSWAPEMRDIINRAVRKTSNDLVTAIQRMLTSPQSTEEPLPSSAYDIELEREDRELFHPMFNWVREAGHFDMTIRPVDYRADRINLHETPRKLNEYAVTFGRGGIIEAVPFEQNHERENSAGGARLWIAHPEWRRVEAASLQSSGVYRIVRAFEEDYLPDADTMSAQFVETNRVLLIDTFVQTMTLLHLRARNIARDLFQDADEQIQIDLRVDGLAGRTPLLNRFDPMASVYIALHSQPGNRDEFSWPLRTTLRALEIEAVSLARERCAEVFWTFGLRGDSIVPTQRNLLGQTEPTAFPPTEA